MLFSKARRLQARLFAHAGKRIGANMRTASEMAAVAKANLLSECHRTAVIFLGGCRPMHWITCSAKTIKRSVSSARNLRLLRKRHEGAEAENSGCQDRHYAQHEIIS
jgi:hypothetical protein